MFHINNIMLTISINHNENWPNYWNREWYDTESQVKSHLPSVSAKITKLYETCPHCRNKLISPNLVQIIQRPLRNVSEEFYDFIWGSSERSYEFKAD